MSISIIQSILFFVSLKIILIYFYSKLASRIGLVDIPNERKNHIGNIPLVGGICIYSCLILYFIFFDTSLNHKIIFVSSMVIFILGLYDDLYNLGVAERIFFQTLICLVIVGFGIRIFDLGTFTIGTNADLLINLGGFGIILTVLCIIGYSNAINFSDGLDGLAGGYLLNVFLSIILFSYYFGKNENLEIIFLIVVLLIVFLFSNFGFILPKIFLGDNGSTSIGFLASCYLIYFTLPENRHFHPVLTLWAAPMPIFDFITIFFYRIINKRSPSNIASYICDGCLGDISTNGNITLQETLVTFPISSPLIKLVIRPKNIPNGDTHAIISSKKRAETSLLIENK